MNMRIEPRLIFLHNIDRIKTVHKVVTNPILKSTKITTTKLITLSGNEAATNKLTIRLVNTGEVNNGFVLEP